ncbi:TetR family transcriptional regulator [Actinokineospora fastidiosa]|uniref:TetR family transcriptional regulator n=1 Tax=Actinokineospora fastidiosa TaxID=1816 RepID=A0A918GLL2_9PSEU|nr:transcriptional repressor BetI [Actinokineospora sp. UTMC 2448]GGS43484.1 TetR family transcriptional regulator [Actinokineospora fastidiosa]
MTDAAIATLARDGLRGLTHRAVDRAAGLPEGSCSYYFRTRHALLVGTVTRMADLDTVDLVPADLPPMDVDHLAALVADLVEQASTTHRDRMLARYELSIEATRRPELRAALTAVGERYRQLAMRIVAATGAGDAERKGRALVAFLDGLIYDRIAGAGARALATEEIRQSVRESLTGILGHPSGS